MVSTKKVSTKVKKPKSAGAAESGSKMKATANGTPPDNNKEQPLGILLEELNETFEEIQNGLNAGKEPSEFDDHYNSFLDIKSMQGKSELKLASQLILRLSSHFTEKQEKIVEALKELINDDDVSVRTSTYSNIRQLCSEDAIFEAIFKSLFSRRLKIENALEDKVLSSLISQIVSKNIPLFLKMIIESTEGLNSKQTKIMLEFISSANESNGNIIARDSTISDSYISLAEKIIGGSEVEAMPLALDILLKIPSVNNLNMRSRLINRFRALAKFKEPYKLTSKSDKKRLEDIFVITKCVEKLFSKNAPSDAFFRHLLHQVLPFFNSLKNEKKINFNTKTLKVMVNFADTLSSVSDESFELIVQLIKESLPSLPENNSEGEKNEPVIHYTLIEPLLIVFYSASSKNQEMFQKTAQDPQFSVKLQYFARCNEENINKWEEFMNQLNEQHTADEKKNLLIGFSIAKNIKLLIRDLIRKTPLFNIDINPSWKQSQETLNKPLDEVKAKKEQAHNKSIAEKEKKEARIQGKVYQPPIGKYSSPNSKNGGPMRKAKKIF